MCPGTRGHHIKYTRPIGVCDYVNINILS